MTKKPKAYTPRFGFQRVKRWPWGRGSVAQDTSRAPVLPCLLRARTCTEQSSTKAVLFDA